MKKIICLLVLLPMIVVGQNYVKTTIYKTPNTTSVIAPDINVANEVITYYDGFGRPIQQVAGKQSVAGKDIIKHIEYDAFGRQPKDFLPYVSASASLNYDPNASSNVMTFYGSPTIATTGNPNFESTTNPYSEIVYEDSALNRIMEQAAPGNDWAIGNGHNRKYEYQANTATEVKLFKATSSWDLTLALYNIDLTASGAINYPSNVLSKTIVKNENWTNGDDNTRQEFRNSEGQLILKRTFGVSVVNSNEVSTAHDSYYVYDQFGNLTYILPPLVDTNTTISQTILDNLCYQYKYDYRNRLVEKKLPGKQWEFIVYDKLDRPIAIGPAFSPFGDGTIGWLITKYDAFSRVAYTGWYAATVTTTTRTSLQNDQNNLTTINYETKTSSGTIDGIAAYYTNTVSPTSFKLLTVNYYDNYTFPNIPSVPTDVEGQNVLTTTKSLPTGSWVRALTTATSTAGETSSTFYDAKSRPIRSYLTNYLGGYTYKDTNLDFSGVPQYTKTYHKRLATDTELKTTEVFTYSPQGRLLTHTHQINSLPVQLLASNTYDELGQLITKNVGNTTTAPLQKVDYAYNIRGWLTGINNDPTDNLVLNTSEKDLFAFKINYNTTAGSVPGIDPLYNGNISETYWRTGSDNVLRKYGYQYDKLNRLKNAIYQKPGGNTYPTYEDYSEKNITYDKNSNIQTLYRNGNLENALPANQIDNLSYSYQANSNKLALLYDSSNNTSGFTDGNLVGDDYTYDSNGNLFSDKNKGITYITYNHLNLPTKIKTGFKMPIEYIYNSLGKKIEKINYIPRRNTTPLKVNTYYLDSFQYQNNMLQFFSTTEGYVKNTAGVYGYVYNYTDHLGNVRVSYQDINNDGVIANSEILEESNYYPFGLKHIGYNSNNTQPDYKYKFQGQERQDEQGLNWDSFKWRNYDPAIGRFMSVDPLAEKYNKWTPYAFAGNQVVHSRELEGLEPADDLDREEPARKDWTGVEGYDVPSAGGGGKEAPVDGNLDEIVVTNDFKAGYDPNGRIDNDSDGYDRDGYDRDGYSREDKANDVKAAEKMVANYQKLGSSLTIIGMVMVTTGIGAPVGAVLIGVGGGFSAIGAAESVVVDVFDRDDDFNTGSHIFDAASIIVPELFKNNFTNGAVGLENLYLELGFTGSGMWFDTISKSKE